ncbi:MAG: nuclease, partial [Thermoleophilia bacterium]|nr:nuclease [Thermoleophilia bacterium]
ATAGRLGRMLMLGGGATLGAALLTGCARQGSPTPTPITPTPTTGPTPTPPTVPTTQRVRIAQLNAYNLFDTVDQPRVQDDVLTPVEYDRKLAKLSLSIRDAMAAPDVIAMEEVENEGVLRDLAARPELAGLGYVPLLVEGTDPRGIDVGYLYRPSRVQLVSHEQRQTTFVSPTGRNIKLFTRPPLVATFRPVGQGGVADASAGRDLTMIVNHFTSQLQGEEGAQKRLWQSQFVASLADGSAGVANLDPKRVVVIGDLNEGVGEPGYQELVEGPTEGVPALVNAAAHLPEADRYSYRRGSKRTLLDHVLITPTLDGAVRQVRIPHINSDSSETLGTDATTYLRSGDHDPVIVDMDL